jgi:hypothetical protein
LFSTTFVFRYMAEKEPSRSQLALLLGAEALQCVACNAKPLPLRLRLRRSAIVSGVILAQKPRTYANGGSELGGGPVPELFADLPRKALYNRPAWQRE